MKLVREKFAVAQTISGQMTRNAPQNTGANQVSPIYDFSTKQARALIGPKPLTDARRFVTHT